TTRGGNLYALGNRLDPKGAQLNLALPGSRGADLYVVAGLADGADYDSFAAVYLDPANRAGVPRTYLPELGKFLRGLGVAAGSDADRLAAFAALPRIQREIFLDGIYLTELRETGIEHNDASSPRFQSYERGYDAVARLFPTDPASVPVEARGDVVLNAKPLETQADAGITVLAPYGAVEVGASLQLPGNDPTRSGVVTRRGGDVRIMSDGNVDLFTSRVFTLQGGDVLMWTSDGSITAGAGAKTSVLQAPLQYKIDAAATITVDSFGLQTGAGIGVLDALGNGVSRPRSRLDLIAPRGEVNAGDAGIRVVGDLNIAAAAVVGIENIQVSGASQGVPKVEAPNLGALTAASQASQTTAREAVGPDSAAAKAAASADLPSIITVEVVGYETSEPGDDARKRDERKRSAPPAR
ncbi:MAG TPA: filamentous hemagglutinin family protein, partial [Anaeromyxobacter sp.]